MKNLILLFILLFGVKSTAQVVVDPIYHYEDIDTGSGPGPIVINPPPPDTTIPKLVYWVHGIAGNAQSWNRVQTSTETQTGNPVQGYPVRNTEGLSVDYSGNENLRIFALGEFVNNEIIELWRVAVPRRDTLPVNKNFVIAHSQGGIVSRAIRHNNLNDPALCPTQFGALATFNTPHGGANIINTTRPANGVVQQWIEEGCVALSSAELVHIKNSKWWLNFLLSTDAVQNFAQSACSGFKGLVLPLIVEDIRKPVGEDYAVGANSIAILENTALQDTMPVVAFYGVEEEPVLWRVLHSMTYTKDASLSGQILFSDPFGLNDDNELPMFINNLINNYRSMEIYHKNQFATYWYGFLFGSYDLTEKPKEMLVTARVYKKAYQFLENANMNWKYFIGARKDSSYIDGYWCVCMSGENYPYIVSDPGECEGASPSEYCFAHPRMVHVILEEPSDGVVPVSSQIAYPGALKRKRMDNTNHMQARNCTETMNRLNELFDGKHGERFRIYRK